MNKLSVLWLRCFVLFSLAVGADVWGRELLRMGPDSSHPSGLCTFATSSGQKTTIHLMQVTNNRSEFLFSTILPNTSHAPICFADYIAVVSTEGEIRRFAKTGRLLHNQVLPDFQGVARNSGKAGETCIFVVETLWGSTGEKPRFLLHLIDLSEGQLRPLKKWTIKQPIRIVSTDDELVIIAKHNIARLSLVPYTRKRK